jgi:transcriptional regulator with XRE-family HTH domain
MEDAADIAQVFAGNLVRARKGADLSQEELGVRASVHRTEISQLERGMRVPRIDTLVKLAGGLSISAEDRLTGLSWSPGRTEVGGFQIRRDQGVTPLDHLLVACLGGPWRWSL